MPRDFIPAEPVPPKLVAPIGFAEVSAGKSADPAEAMLQEHLKRARWAREASRSWALSSAKR